MQPENNGPAGQSGLINRLIADALMFTRAQEGSTARLRTMKHDRDLVPLITRQLGQLLSGLQRDTNVTYDIQGLHDNGVDSLVRIKSPTGSDFIGLQIKSHSEIQEKDIATKLIVQYHAAREHFAELRYYVVLAADLSDTRARTQVRTISAKFAKQGNVAIIEPQYVAAFLGLTQPQMDSMVTRVLRPGDPVLLQARDELESLSALEAAVALRMLASTLGGIGLSLDQFIGDDWICSIAERFNQHRGVSYYTDYQKWRADFYALLHETPDPHHSNQNGPISSALEALMDAGVADLTSQGGWVVRPSEVVGLLCLASEGYVRHDLQGQQLADYLVNLLA